MTKIDASMYIKQPSTAPKWLLAHFHTTLSGTMKTTRKLNAKTDLLLQLQPSPISQIKFLCAKNIPNPPADLTVRRRSESVNRNFSRAPSPVLSISLLFGFVCHPQPSEPPADWERASLPQLASWAPCLPSILPCRSQASYKGGMNYGLVQPRGFCFFCFVVFFPFLVSCSQTQCAQIGFLFAIHHDLITSYCFQL